MKIKRQPRFRKKNQQYKFFFNKKTKINSLISPTSLSLTTNYLRNGDYHVYFTKSCQLQYYTLRGLYNVLLPLIKQCLVKL
jgi:hypothetical protein